MSAEAPIRLLIVDDYEFTRLGLRAAIVRKSQYVVAGEASNGKEAVDFVRAEQPNVVLMDIAMPEMDGITATEIIKTEFPDTKVVILSSRQNRDEVLASMAAGADAYCMKDITTERMFQMMETLIAGGVWLDPQIAKILSNTFTRPAGLEPLETPLPSRADSTNPYASVVSKPATHTGPDLTEREREVLGLIVDGKSNKEIGLLLGISVATTKGHVSNLIQKLSVDDRTQAAVKALKEGLIQQYS